MDFFQYFVVFVFSFNEVHFIFQKLVHTKSKHIFQQQQFIALIGRLDIAFVVVLCYKFNFYKYIDDKMKLTRIKKRMKYIRTSQNFRKWHKLIVKTSKCHTKIEKYAPNVQMWNNLCVKCVEYVCFLCLEWHLNRTVFKQWIQIYFLTKFQCSSLFCMCISNSFNISSSNNSQVNVDLSEHINNLKHLWFGGHLPNAKFRYRLFNGWPIGNIIIKFLETWYLEHKCIWSPALEHISTLLVFLVYFAHE